jgi:nucleoside-diphosphate-sugar epimerase
MSQRILVTGHRGYIGSVLVPVFRQAGYDVTGLDTDYFGECTLVPDQEEVPALRKDLRDLEPEDVAGFHAVVHLGALSNDPIGNLNPSWTDEINYRASVRLATLARDAGVARFLFSSSCIMYGMSEAQEVTEESPLDPQTDYARSKVKSEQAISTLATDRFSPTFLRNGTVYGLSPRMRFDTVLNDLVGRAITTGRVVVHSDGTPWRPVVHVQDVARLFLAVLEAPRSRVHNQAINAGAAELNRQILELAELVAAAVPGCSVDLVPQPGADQRTYRANFDKLGRLLPDFRFRYAPAEGARELVAAFRAVGLTHEHFTDQRFIRLRWLRHLRSSGLLDGSLRWTRVEAAAV